MTGVEKISEVRYLRFVKKLPIKAIVRQIKLSRNTIRKIIRSKETKFLYTRKSQTQPVRSTIRDLINEWMTEDLKQKPKYRRTARRMYDLLQGWPHEYKGSYESVIRCVRELKTELRIKTKGIYIPLIYAPGEAFQFDWGDMKAYIDGKLTTLQLAIITLCHSRHSYYRVYPCQKQELMLDAHKRAFEHFGGVCRRGIYDNLKTAVKSLLKGHHRNLQERFVQFCSHYLYEPQFCNRACGNEKGQVENKVKVTRSNFFVPIPKFDSLENLNNALLSYAISESRMRKHPEYPEKSRWEVYEEEKEQLTQMPGFSFECCRIQQAHVTPICTVFFDMNEYSVPDDYAGKILQVKGYADEVAISYNGKNITTHKRSFESKQKILNPLHYLGILSRKPGALKDGRPFKNWNLPKVFNDYRKLLNRKYPEGDTYYAKTLVLLKDWPLKDVTEAVKKAIKLKVAGDGYVLSLVKKQDNPEQEAEYLSVKSELACYKAKQQPLSYYDEVLRKGESKA